MQISLFLQILLHFSWFCIGLVLVLADKRCLQSNSDGTDMLFLFIVYAYFCSVDLTTLLAAYGGGVFSHSGVKPSACLVNNYTQVLFIVFVDAPLSARRVPQSLSAPGILPAPGDIGRPADGRCGLLI